MQIPFEKRLDKIQKASMMNSEEETVCTMCNQIIFMKEIFMICQVKEYRGEIKLKNICCDCFQKKIVDDVDRIRKWSDRTTTELAQMLLPIRDYMNSETKKKVDENRRMLNRIEDVSEENAIECDDVIGDDFYP